MTVMPKRGNSLESRDIASVVHPYTNLNAHETDGPFVVARGEGIQIFDHAGKAYIDGMASLWSCSLGYSEQRLIDAAVRQFAKLPTFHIFAGRSHDPAIELAEKLLSIAPVAMSKVLFANSGSEATDTALKLVWYYNNAVGRPAKKKIISRIKGYHGVTIASASLTGLPANHRDFDLPIARILHTDCPHYWAGARPGESEAAFVARLADSLEQLIMKEGPETVAAFIAEPVMGAGGVIVPPAGYFQAIQPILRKHEILFIADEVICGFGRTGNMFGTQTYDLKPDMITVAKALSSGYLPISATLISEPIYRAMVDESKKIGTFGHGTTYAAHPVAAAVALETLKIYEERDTIGHVQRVMKRFQSALARHAAHPLVGEVQSVGLVAGIQIVRDKAAKTLFEPAKAAAAYVAKRAQEHGLIVRNVYQDRVTICPPLIITEAQIDELSARLGKALDDAASWSAKAV